MTKESSRTLTPAKFSKFFFMRLLSKTKWLQVGVYLAILAICCYAAYVGSTRMGYNWQWYNVPKYFFVVTADGIKVGSLIWGIGATAVICFYAFLLALATGTMIAMLRLSDLIVGRAIALCTLEFIRNIPLLVLLYLFYFVLGPVFGWERFSAAVLCLGIFHGALVSEIIRAGINSVPLGQWEAAKSIGMSQLQAYRYIIVPQAFRFMLPPLTGEAIQLVKSSAIASVIGVAELTTLGRNIISETYMSFEIWLAVAAIYFSITFTLSMSVNSLERRLKRNS
ncbi:amino acid ABC transporter permease [Rhizobium sp. G187]|uniref:amino acid ABC transporter permease n=1 Tax=Rhizobium sp. G187 TaxID=3451352 RepID=UPI003EE566DC